MRTIRTSSSESWIEPVRSLSSAIASSRSPRAVGGCRVGEQPGLVVLEVGGDEAEAGVEAFEVGRDLPNWLATLPSGCEPRIENAELTSG